jgi:hypothetical protein
LNTGASCAIETCGIAKAVIAKPNQALFALAAIEAGISEGTFIIKNLLDSKG